MSGHGNRHHGARWPGAALAVVAALLAGACGSSSSVSSPPASSSPASGGSSPSSGTGTSGTVNGSGSTFQLTFQQEAITEFRSVQPDIRVSYAGGGSGKGRADLASGVVNFAGSDSPIPANEQASFNGKTVLYFPVLIGPITISFNVPDEHRLQLSAPVIAKIFEGAITKWSDPAIAADNNGAKLPDIPIVIARRSDSSGTTANFTDFLVRASGGAWTLGSGSTIKWPASSRGGSGNAGVAQIVKSTSGAIGYVDYADAEASGLDFAYVKNQAGSYIAPSPATASGAVGYSTINRDLTFSAIWAPGAGSYPITYQSWDLVYQAQPNAQQAKALQAYIGYLVGDGQKLLSSLGYAALPPTLRQQAQDQVSKIGSAS